MDVYDSSAKLQFLLRIFSLHHINRTKRDFIDNFWLYTKPTFIMCFCSFFICYNAYLHHKSDMTRTFTPSMIVTNAVGIILCYIQYIVDLFITYKYRNQMSDYYYTYGQIDEVFKMKYNNDMKRSVTKLLVVLLPPWLISALAEICVWSQLGGWFTAASFSATNIICFIRLLTALDFVTQTFHIRLRFKSIVDHIEEFASFTEDSPNRVKINRSITRKQTKVMPSISEFKCEIAKSNGCYLLLIEQVSFLNNFFGVRVLMHCLYALREMIMFVNFIAKVISGSMSHVMISDILVLPNVLRFINVVTLLTALVYYCEACYREIGDIVDAVDRFLVNKKTTQELAYSLKTLRKLVISRPLTFTAAGFFKLESTLLLSIASVVITYALIIVQSTQ